MARELTVQKQHTLSIAACVAPVPREVLSSYKMLQGWPGQSPVSVQVRIYIYTFLYKMYNIYNLLLHCRAFLSACAVRIQVAPGCTRR